MGIWSLRVDLGVVIEENLISGELGSMTEEEILRNQDIILKLENKQLKLKLEDFSKNRKLAL